MSNILIIAPHCDDEILGCGGIMTRFKNEGHNIYVVIVTNGHVGAPELFSSVGTERVQNEARNAHKFLGVTKSFFLNFPAPRLDSIPSYKLSISLEKLIRQYNISELYVPHRGDIHKDHRITYESALVAARPVNENPVKRIYAYETLSETEWSAPFSDDAFIPNVFYDIEDFLEFKLKAFSFFETQEKMFPHPRSQKTLEHLARLRGTTVGFKAAEAFMLIREIK